jgi:hypothetical protein
LLDGRPSKAGAVAAVLADRSPLAAAQPFYRALDLLGANVADEALIALRLALAGRPVDDAAAVPAVALAAPSPAASAPATHDGGTINGRVTSIDYQRSILGVDAVGRGHIDVNVMPSTSIQAKDAAYHAFTDLKTGERVQIFSSITNGTYVAQIIRIR